MRRHEWVRCTDLINSINRLPESTNLTHSCRRTLLKLVHSDLTFLCSLPALHASLSLNVGHLEAVVRILHHPSVCGVSRVCKPLPIPDSSFKSAHVDIICTLYKRPVWIIVSDRNPKYLSWHDLRGNKGLKFRLLNLLDAARSSPTLRPSSLILFFANGLPSYFREKLGVEFGASEFDFDSSEDAEGEWVHVFSWSYWYENAFAFEIPVKVDSDDNGVDSSFGSLPAAAGSELQEENAKLKIDESSKPWDLLGDGHPLNFDTTALIALVSGITNGGAQQLLGRPENELKQRFKGNFEFVIALVMSERQSPLHLELGGILSGRKGIICESVLSEFKELIQMCGGPNEKHRADQLLKRLLVVPDNPSERMMALPTTRKLALKKKVVFGTGDLWHAPTLTANMSFVRAVSQTGMSLHTIEHRPRALTGD